MATWYLLNTTSFGNGGVGQKFLSGRFMNDATDPTALVQASGGVLWPSSDAVVAAAASLVQLRQKNRAISEAESDSIMDAAAANSVLAGGVAVGIQHVVVDIPLATIQAQTSGTAFNVGAALPANARLVDENLNVLTAVSGGAISAVTATLQGGADAAGTIIASHSVFTGANPTNSPIGSNPYPSRGGQQLKLTLTSTGGALSTATAGHLSLDLFYTVQP